MDARPQHVAKMKPHHPRSYVRLQFDLPAAAADAAAALLVANRALGCEVSKLRPSHPAPARTPREIVERLNSEIVKMMRSPEVNEQFIKQGLEVFASTPEQFSTLIKSETAKWGKIIADAGIKE